MATPPPRWPRWSPASKPATRGADASGPSWHSARSPSAGGAVCSISACKATRWPSSAPPPPPSTSRTRRSLSPWSPPWRTRSCTRRSGAARTASASDERDALRVAAVLPHDAWPSAPWSGASSPANTSASRGWRWRCSCWKPACAACPTNSASWPGSVGILGAARVAGFDLSSRLALVSSGARLRLRPARPQGSERPRAGCRHLAGDPLPAGRPRRATARLGRQPRLGAGRARLSPNSTAAACARRRSW